MNNFLKNVLIFVVLHNSFSVFSEKKSESDLKIVFKEQNNFPIVANNAASSIWVSKNDAEVVRIAAKSFSEDVKLITGAQPEIQSEIKSDKLIIVGTLGSSEFIDSIAGKLTENVILKIRNKWESFIISTVNNPVQNVKQALVVIGSNRRGTAYGLFELSRLMGVSPWVWWADVKPAQHKNIFVTPGTLVSGEPSVKYRGIFLNDEDWGLKPWAAQNMDTDVKDIGPKTYEKIFLLLLRLKANMIWPAMHDCTKAFYYYPENPVIADKYAIVVGGSHCEPMLRNNVFEWKRNYENEYGVKPADWRYDTNKSEIYRYWDDRIKTSQNYESVYTIGMRGIHDGSMPGPKTMSGKKTLMDTVIRDQRQIFTNYFKNSNAVPQIFCPYKEVLDIYNYGLKLPDDVTLMWADDNYGYIRQLSNDEERKRSGGAGVYYHISYLGRPHDYIWLESTPVSLIWNEMHKAYETNAKNVWILNVGDIKPNEIGMSFFLNLAWDIHKYKPSQLNDFYTQFALEQFGEKYAKQTGEILKQYFQLAFPRRPEFMGWSTTFPITPTKDPDFEVSDNKDETQQRIDAYEKLDKQTEKLYNQLPATMKDAFYQLVAYKVIGAANMNKKILYAYKSRVFAAQKRIEANQFAEKANLAFEKIKSATAFYNDTMSAGKWKGMMSWNPRKLPVYEMPKTATILPDSAQNYVKQKSVTNKSEIIRIETERYNNIQNTTECSWSLIQGLGLETDAVGTFPITAKVQNNSAKISYSFQTKTSGEATIRFYCLPSQPINVDYRLRFGVSLNNDKPIELDAALAKPINEDYNQEWRTNVLRNTTIRETKMNFLRKGNQTLTISMIDPGVVIDRFEIIF